MNSFYHISYYQFQRPHTSFNNHNYQNNNLNNNYKYNNNQNYNLNSNLYYSRDFSSHNNNYNNRNIYENLYNSNNYINNQNYLSYSSSNSPKLNNKQITFYNNENNRTLNNKNSQFNNNNNINQRKIIRRSNSIEFYQNSINEKNNVNNNNNNNSLNEKYFSPEYPFNNQKNEYNFYKENNQNKIKNISKSQEKIISFLPPKNSPLKTLILDLDETLVHSSFKNFPFAPDLLLKIPLDKKIYFVNVLIRPYVYEFLNEMSKYYELIIFTASVSTYANALLNKLDVNKKISFRLFRQHCNRINGGYLKDLKKVGRNLKDLIILDNNPISYLNNKENGIPIKTWHSDKKDFELMKLIPIFQFLSKVNDVRDYIKRIVKNNEIDFNEFKNIVKSEKMSYKKSNNVLINSKINANMINQNKNNNNYIKEINNNYVSNNENKMYKTPLNNNKYQPIYKNVIYEKQNKSANKNVNTFINKNTNNNNNIDVNKNYHDKKFLAIKQIPIDKINQLNKENNINNDNINFNNNIILYDNNNNKNLKNLKGLFNNNFYKNSSIIRNNIYPKYG